MQALWSSKQTSAFPPRHYTQDQGSKLLPLESHGFPGSAGGLRRRVARDPSRAPRQVLAARLGEEGAPDAGEWPCRSQSCTDRSMVPPQSPLTGWEEETSRQAGTWWPSSDDWAPQAKLGTDRVSVPQGDPPAPLRLSRGHQLPGPEGHPVSHKEVPWGQGVRPGAPSPTRGKPGADRSVNPAS